MSAREEILARLRGGRGVSSSERPPVRAQELYPDLRSGEEALAQFCERLKNLRGEAIVAADAADAAVKLLQRLTGAEPEACGVQRPFGLLDRLCAVNRELADRCARMCAVLPESSEEYSKLALGLTGADALVSRSGSVVLRGATAGGRRLSVLPERHIVVAGRSQIIPSLAPWLSRLEGDPGTSMATIISGPSRTSDIEKVLVLGAHGPRELTVIVLPD